MTATSVGMGWIEILLLVLGGGGLLGTPPADRDPAFLKAAPQNSLAYVEWAARGPGKPGASGVDGFVADPEIVALLQAIDQVLTPTEASSPPSVEIEVDQQPLNRDALRLAKLVTAHSGCLFVFADPPRAPKGLLDVLKPGDALSQFHACLVVNTGADAAGIVYAFNRATRNQVPTQPQMVPVLGPNGVKLTVHQQGDRLLVGFGQGTIERALVGLSGTGPGLDSNPRFAAGWKRVATERVGSLAWIDTKGATDAAIQSLGPAGLIAQTILRGAGIDAIDSVVAGSGVMNGNVIQRTFISTGGRSDGVLMLAKNLALKPEQFAHIPADSDMVLATSLDLGQLVNGVRELVAKTNPLSLKVFDQATREFEAELGLSLAADLYPAFGNAWTVFNSPLEGGMFGSNTIVALEVRDPVKAQIVLDRLMQLLEQSLSSENDTDYGSTAELKHHEFMGHGISYIRRAGGTFGPTVSTSPSFCLTRGHILFALHPQAIKSHLRYLSQPRPGFETVARTKLSLSDQELLFAGYLDGARSTRNLSGLAPFLAQTLTDMAQSHGVEFDPFVIPSTAALAPYAGDVTTSIARQKDGLFVESKNPQLAIALVMAFGSVKSLFRGEYEMLLEAKRQRAHSVEHAGLGNPDGRVVPAAAVKPEAPKEPVAGAVARRVTPLLLRALVPDGVQVMIPNEAFQPPSPEVLQMREERRKLNEEKRRQRLERRGVPLPPPPPPR
ncbi:MAG TPA: hypothetical protein VGM98_07215 [Schlesneria sp.]